MFMRSICKQSDYNPMRTILILMFLFTLSLSGFAQFKYEKESRVNKRDVPAFARNFVDSLNFSSKVKWYKEIGFSTVSFEAKTRHKGKRYSVEFSEAGSFEDIEIEIKPNEIPSEVYNEISNYLTHKHINYSIEKIQIQYSGDANGILDYFNNIGSGSDLVTNYEIVVTGKMDGTFKMIEYLFSKDGSLLQMTPITSDRTDNIEY
jgi:hypothetical protein